MAKDPITLYRYGTPRSRDELVRIGVARQVPRGVKKEDWQRLGYFDTRLPLLSPSAGLIKAFRHEGLPFATFRSRYLKEMQAPESRQVVELLAAMIAFEPISLGCFCEEESHCHRSILKELILKTARERATTAPASDANERERFASPVCYMESPQGEA